jgi:MFS family permease
VLFATGWSLSVAACAFAENFLSFTAGRLVMGAFQAGIFPCATLILKVWYPASRRGLATALLNSFMLIGGAAGTVVTGALLSPVGWRGTFILYAIPGLLWAAWFAWWFHNRPAEHPGVNKAELDVIQGPQTPATADATGTAPRPEAVVSEQVKAHHDSLASQPSSPLPAPNLSTSAVVSRSRWALVMLAILTLVLLYTQQAFRAGANRLFDTWMPAYYELEKGTSKEMGAYLSALLQLMGVAGGMMGGLLSDEVLRRTGSLRAARNGVALFSLTGSVALYFAAFPIPNVYVSSLVFSLGVFLFCFSSPCAYALTMDVGGKYLAVVFALMNTFGNLGAWAFVSFAGYLRDWGGWNLVLLVFVGMHVAAAVCWIFLNPNATLEGAFARRSE